MFTTLSHESLHPMVHNIELRTGLSCISPWNCWN